MQAQNLRSRRTPTQHAKSSTISTKTKDSTFGETLLNHCTNFSVFGIIAIFIFYSVRFLYFKAFGAPNANKGNGGYFDMEGYTEEDFNNYWQQPVISMDAIPKSIYTISDSQECGDLNPDWDFHFYSKSEAVDILKNAYNLNDETLSTFQYTLDLFKYHIINQFGGFYIEPRGECTGDLDQWLAFYYPINHVHFNNYYYVEEGETGTVELDMVIAFESEMPYAFNQWVFFTKPDNPILEYIIDSYLQPLGINDEKESKGDDKEGLYVGPNMFTEAIVGFADAFTTDGKEALSFHKFEDGKAHVVSMYLNEEDLYDVQKTIDKEDMLNIMVVPLPDIKSIVRRKRANLRRTRPIHD